MRSKYEIFEKKKKENADITVGCKANNNETAIELSELVEPSTKLI